MRSSWVFAISYATATSAQIVNTYPDCVRGPLASNGVCNATLSPSQRAAALVAAMTNDEKLQNIVSKSKGVSRIGLPAYNWWSEALHGVAYAPGTQFRNGQGTFNSSTSFPMPLLMAAAFNDKLIEDIGTAIGIEARAFGNSGWSGLDIWTPNVNPFKDPRWGRGSETPGEDILRIKRYAASMIKGLEGPNPGATRRVVATCKHFAGNDFEDWNGATRHNFNAKISMQDLAEYYMMPFQQCARDSRVGSIMCAYNAVNGVPSCANSYLMETILRGHWNWTEHNNYITSDCEAVLDVSANHKFARSNAEGTAMCFKAGMDLSCEYSGSSDIPGAWSQRLLDQATIDRALKRLYEGLVRVGYFDGAAGPYGSLGWSAVNAPSSQQLALQAAVEGIVLLKNDGTLPLRVSASPSPKIALVGFWADAGDKLTGGYSGTPAYLRSPAEAARRMGLSVSVFSGGPVLQGASARDTWTSGAVAAARAADYVVYFGGLDTSAAGETKDRMNIEWPAAQLALIKSLAALGKPLVVVQLGDQVDDTPLLAMKEVNAILWANWPSQDGGTAIMQLLTGVKSPAGRLPVTQYPAAYTSQVAMTDMDLRPSSKNPGRTYRWFPTPVKPFGFGLHYTTFKADIDSFPSRFAIGDLIKGCQNTYLDTCAFQPLTMKVTNTGNFTSDYVTLAFVSGEFGPKPYPIKTLAAYTRLHDLAPGASATVNLEWTLGNIARHDENGNTVLYPGTYVVTIDEPTLTTVRFVLEGDAYVLDKWPSPPR